MLARSSPRTFLLTIAGAIIVAGAFWWICTNYYRLWNLRFRIGGIHHALCAVAAAMTLVFTVVYVSMRNTAEITNRAISQWHEGARKDRKLIDAAFARGYYAVKATGLEDFSKAPLPGQPGAMLPLSRQDTRELASKSYVAELLDDFRKKNPFLVRALSLPDPPLGKIQADRDRFTKANPGKNYDMSRAVDLAATHTRDLLVPQSPRTVTYVRRLAILLLLLFQAIPFAVIGFAAYQDLREQR